MKTQDELLREAHDIIQEVLEEVAQRVRDKGLDPEKYSSYIKAKQSLKNIKEHFNLKL